VGTLAEVRPVWCNEEWLPTSYGRAADMRYAHMAAFYVLDRGYVDYIRLARIARAGAFFVTRAKDNLCFTRHRSLPVDGTTGLRSDKDYVVSVVGRASTVIHLVDPRAGQVIWSADTGAGRALSYGALLAGDVLVYYSGEFGENTVKGCSVQAYRVTAEKLEKLWSVPGPAEALDSCGLTVSGGRVFISGEKETLCLALRDGSCWPRRLWAARGPK
jgi:outer membrane protein assembly factor BamB